MNNRQQATGNRQRLIQLPVCLFFLLLAILLPSVCHAQIIQRQFSVYNTDNGLPQSSVLHISQQQNGSLIIVTLEGICRFDGNVFSKISTNNNPATKNEQYILDAVADNNKVWMLSGMRGILLVDFTTGKTYQKNIHKIADYTARLGARPLLVRGKDGLVYLTAGGSLYQVTANNSIEVKEILKFENELQSVISVSSTELICATPHQLFSIKTVGSKFSKTLITQMPDELSCVTTDNAGQIWVGTDNNGIYKIAVGKVVAHISVAASLSSNHITCLQIDHKQRLWIGTKDNGLDMLDPATGAWEHYHHVPLNTNSISENAILSLYEDIFHTLWIGTISGLNRVSLSNNFSLFRFSNPNTLHPKSNFIWSVLSDEQKNIWIASLENGVSVFNSTKEITQSYRHTGQKNSLLSDLAYNIIQDREKHIWITSDAGVNLYLPSTNSFRSYPEPDAMMDINGMLFDKSGRTFICDHHKGLFTFNKSTGAYQPQKFFNSLFKQGNERSIGWITEDTFRNCFWLATNIGLIKCNNTFDKATIIRLGQSDTVNMREYYLHAYHLDHLHRLWLGTADKGLCSYEPETNRIHFYSLFSDYERTILAIQCDKLHRFWIATSGGIILFDPVAKKVLAHYDIADGLQGSEFNERAHCTDASGNIYFGGNNGITIFNPAEIGFDSIAPIVQFTAMGINNNDSVVRLNLKEYKTITLRPNQSQFEIRFTGMQTASAQKVTYRYKLVGFDKEFISTTDGKAAYTNLSPGNYTLEVFALNRDGIISKNAATINVELLAPFYKTKWFLLLQFLALLLIGYLIYRNRIKMLQLEADKKIANETNRIKDEFLAGMTHEIRTPITSIIGVNELLRENCTDSDAKLLLDLAQRSADNLLVIIDDILDLAKINSGKLRIQEQSFNLHQLVNDVYEIFSHRSNNQQIQWLVNISPALPKIVFGDPVRIRQVIINLVSNAIKFTTTGYVKLEVDFDKQMLLFAEEGIAQQDVVGIYFKVTDTGIGIAPEKLKNVFESFTQVHADPSRTFGGTGLGLTISQQLAMLMKGYLKAESEFGKGSCFTFSVTLLPVKEQTETVTKNALPNADFLNQKNILLVEDNEINRNIISRQLKLLHMGLSIQTAADGSEALQLIQQNNFDAVLMDIYMPVMDGLEATRKIRTELPPTKNNLPIIGLTATAIPTEIKRAIDAGMNDCISKPFDKKVLLKKLCELL